MELIKNKYQHQVIFIFYIFAKKLINFNFSKNVIYLKMY